MSIETMERTQTATIPVNTLTDLLSGALVCAGKDDFLPVLCAVQLTFTTDTVTAAATDRYRLIVGTAPTGDDSPGSFTVLIGRADVERIIKMGKNWKNYPKLGVGITLDDQTVTVTFLTDSMTFKATDGTFPPYVHLLPTIFAPIESLNVNPDLLASFAKIPHGKGSA